MSIYKSTDSRITALFRQDAPPTGWRFNFPNAADFNFNYHKLLADAGDTGIGKPGADVPKVAIIGAGVAGLTAARELFRSGYTSIHIYEASNRIGGRNYSIPVGTAELGVTYEMGAMRLPFFTEPGSENCALDYYRSLFDIAVTPFPNPGSDHTDDTGIYVNGGLGPDPDNPYPKPRLDIWKPDTAPPNPLYQAVKAKWDAFDKLVRGACQPLYNASPDPKKRDEIWNTFWKKVFRNYSSLNFRELVLMPSLADEFGDDRRGIDEQTALGNFGGLGMTAQEAELFYVIGAGDGGWGAFYDISCLFPMRTLLFGYGDNHQLIVGKKNPPAPRKGQPKPNYRGVQTFAECMFFEKVASAESKVNGKSLADATSDHAFDVSLRLSTPVTGVTRLDTGRIDVATKNDRTTYDIVIVTPTTWSVNLGIELAGFDQKLLPWSVTSSLRLSHWITSCKVFYRLRENYWADRTVPEDKRIPQVISTDTFLQGLYGYAVDDKPGVVLASYTWEDDATKLTAYTDEQLGAACLAELDRMLTATGREPMSKYLADRKAEVIHWSRVPSYHGAAKLYRQHSWDQDYPLLAYNQNHSAESGLYFAGEGYSVEGGWTESAVRSALDAVVHLIHNTGTFRTDFDFDSDYPEYQNWLSPAELAELDVDVPQQARDGAGRLRPPAGSATSPRRG